MKITTDMIKEDADIFFIEGYIDAAFLHGSVISVVDAKILLDRVHKAVHQKLIYISKYFTESELIEKWSKIILAAQDNVYKKLNEMTVL